MAKKLTKADQRRVDLAVKRTEIRAEHGHKNIYIVKNVYSDQYVNVSEFFAVFDDLELAKEACAQFDTLVCFKVEMNMTDPIMERVRFT